MKNIVAACIAVVSLLIFTNAYAAGPFTGLAGNWKGEGRVLYSDGRDEVIRCHAMYGVSFVGDEVSLNLSCASQSYNIKASGTARSVNGRVSGTFHENSNNVDGTITGTVRGGTIAVELEAKKYVFNLDVVTDGRYQTITITPTGTNIGSIIVNMTRQ